MLALAATIVSLLARTRWPVPVLAIVLALAATTNYGPITSLAALLALLNVVMTCDRVFAAVGAWRSRVRDA